MADARPAPLRPWLFVGTIPEAAFPLVLSPFSLEIGRGQLHPGRLHLGGTPCAVNRGTPAMLAAASLTRACLDPEAAEDGLYVLAAGDTGNGEGSAAVYARLAAILPELRPCGVTFHYLLPDVDWHNRILMAVEALPERPLLVADAGHMYAAKMSGYAREYDLFTPDTGELAFLADELAPHPFYTRNFLLADEARAEELIARAHENGNAAPHMLVKGKTDRYAREGTVAERVHHPDVPMLEPVGGTGDTLTGIVSGLLASGLSMEQACPAAFRINRRMGLLARPTPASSVMDLLPFLPRAIEETLGSSFASV